MPSRDEQRQDHLDKAVWHLKQWARSEARDELAGEIDQVVQMHDVVIGALHELTRKMELQRQNYAYRVPKLLLGEPEPEPAATTFPPAGSS